MRAYLKQSFFFDSAPKSNGLITLAHPFSCWVATVTDYLTEPPVSMEKMPFSVHQSDFIKKSKSFILSGILVVLRLTELITSTPET